MTYLDSDDKWLEEVRGLIETQRRPDSRAAFLAKLDVRIGGERTCADTTNYLVNTLWNAIRYADALLGTAISPDDPVPHARNAPPNTVRREVVRDTDGRIVALEEGALVNAVRRASTPPNQ